MLEFLIGHVTPYLSTMSCTTSLNQGEHLWRHNNTAQKFVQIYRECNTFIFRCSLKCLVESIQNDPDFILEGIANGLVLEYVGIWLDLYFGLSSA